MWVGGPSRRRFWARGQATADNLPALQADLQYMIRVPDLAMAEQVSAALDRIAEASAALCGCRVGKALGQQVAPRGDQSRDGVPGMGRDARGWRACLGWGGIGGDAAGAGGVRGGAV